MRDGCGTLPMKRTTATTRTALRAKCAKAESTSGCRANIFPLRCIFTQCNSGTAASFAARLAASFGLKIGENFFERREALSINQFQKAKFEVKPWIRPATKIVISGKQQVEKAQ